MSGDLFRGGCQRASQPCGHDPRGRWNSPILRGRAVGLCMGVSGQRIQDRPSLPQPHQGRAHVALGWRRERIPLHSPTPKVHAPQIKMTVCQGLDIVKSV